MIFLDIDNKELSSYREVVDKMLLDFQAPVIGKDWKQERGFSGEQSFKVLHYNQDIGDTPLVDIYYPLSVMRVSFENSGKEFYSFLFRSFSEERVEKRLTQLPFISQRKFLDDLEPFIEVVFEKKDNVFIPQLIIKGGVYEYFSGNIEMLNIVPIDRSKESKGLFKLCTGFSVHSEGDLSFFKAQITRYLNPVMLWVKDRDNLAKEFLREVSSFVQTKAYTFAKNNPFRDYLNNTLIINNKGNITESIEKAIHNGLGELITLYAGQEQGGKNSYDRVSLKVESVEQGEGFIAKIIESSVISGGRRYISMHLTPKNFNLKEVIRRIKTGGYEGTDPFKELYKNTYQAILILDKGKIELVELLKEGYRDSAIFESNLIPIQAFENPEDRNFRLIEFREDDSFEKSRFNISIFDSISEIFTGHISCSLGERYPEYRDMRNEKYDSMLLDIIKTYSKEIRNDGLGFKIPDDEFDSFMVLAKTLENLIQDNNIIYVKYNARRELPKEYRKIISDYLSQHDNQNTSMQFGDIPVADNYICFPDPGNVDGQDMYILHWGNINLYPDKESKAVQRLYQIKLRVDKEEGNPAIHNFILAKGSIEGLVNLDKDMEQYSLVCWDRYEPATGTSYTGIDNSNLNLKVISFEDEEQDKRRKLIIDDMFSVELI